MLRYSTGDPCSQESRTAWEGRVYPGISQSEFRSSRLFLSGETGSWGNTYGQSLELICTHTVGCYVCHQFAKTFFVF